MSTLAIGDVFPSMKEAKLSITAALKDNGQSYWTETSKPMRFVLKCKTVKDQEEGEEDILHCEFKV
jgi:hypothetical protein